ncbi:hypothetical protein LPJ73_003832 [Coemansia sp. RSA 2703]|nr:hypothetical protein LPJ73_003832 [Coemansia sp. RSA 2703]
MTDLERPADENSALLPRQRTMTSAELRGYVLMAASALGFATNSACVKALALSGLPALEIVLLRSVLQLTLGLFGCLAHGANPLGPHDPRAFRWLVARGFFGAFGNACFFYAVTAMPLADATVVFFTGPVFSALFASLLLHEPYDFFDRLLSALGLSGIVLVVRPRVLFGGNGGGTDGGQVAWGTAAALVGAMSGALAYCAVRKAGSSVHAMVHVVWFGVLSLLGSSLALYVTGGARWPSGSYEWCVAGLLGLSAFMGQALLNRGLQLVPAGPGMLVRNLDVVFAFAFGVLVFGEQTGLLPVVGALVIVLSTVAMGVRKWTA